MTESDIRRIVREELEAERALVAAERKAAEGYAEAKWAAMRAEIDRRLAESNGQYGVQIADEVQRRFDNDASFLRR